MTNSLIQFDSPRAFQNAGGKVIHSSTIAKLSADLLAEREPANPTPGEVSFLVLKLNPDGPTLAAIVEALGALAGSASRFAEPNTIAKRDDVAGLVASRFHGESLKALADTDTVSLETIDGKGVEVARENPGGQVKLAFYNQSPITRQEVSASSLTLADDLAVALNALGLIDLTA